MNDVLASIKPLTAVVSSLIKASKPAKLRLVHAKMQTDILPLLLIFVESHLRGRVGLM
jgi:hypothetical protein